jgi:Carboxypeptidase regulatory-like domain
VTKFAAGFLLIFCFAATAHAQGVGASGEITGTITDPSKAVVPQANVVAIETATGIEHRGVTDPSGQYRIANLPPASYDVRVEAAGFAKQLQSGAVVTVGGTTVVDFSLVVSGSTAEVKVNAAPPVVETQRGSQANTITETYISDLPINRRDYLTFTLLAPGVSNSTRLADDQDFRVKQTPQSGLSFYGSNGRGNTVTVDGGEFNDDSGGVRLTLSQEAVQEFQINRSDYAAELGGASGAAINIVSKSGTNELHGSLFGFFRDDVFDARNPFSYGNALIPTSPFSLTAVAAPVKDSLSRQQSGGSIGGPIRHDKTFFFGSFEGLHQDAQNAVPLLTNSAVLGPDNGEFSGNNQAAILTGLANLGATPVPCLTGQPALPAATCAGILQNVLTVNPTASPLSAFLVDQLETNGGVFPYNTREYLASFRLDHQFSEHDETFFRYAYGHDLEENPEVQSLTGFSAGSSFRMYSHTLQGSWFHTFSPSLQNELRLQWDYTDENVIPNEPGEAGLAIPGFGNFGTNIFLPNLAILRRYEIADNVTWIRGHHTLRFGFYELYRGDHTEAHAFLPGRFVFGNLPGGILSPCLQVPAACGLPANTSPAALNALQSANLGLPQFYQQGFGNPVYNFPRPFTAFFAQDSWQVMPNLTLDFGLRYELESQYGPLSSDLDNFAPRVSFAWDPWSDHKTVVRGGFGIFYSPIDAQITDVVKTLGLVNGNRQIAQVFVPLTGVPGNPALTSAAVFQTLFAEGLVSCTTPTPGNAACITPSNLTPFGITVTHTGAVPPFSVLFSGQPNYQSPYSEQASIGVEREISPGFSISANGIYVHTLRLPVAIDTNLLPAPFVTANSPFNPGKTVTFEDWGAPQCRTLPSPCFVNPFILQNNQYSSAATALYEGGILEAKKRFSQYFTFMANYTYSKAYDTTTDYNSDYAPQNELDLAADRGLSDFDQRNKFVAAAVLDSGRRSSLLWSGWELAPIVSANSGHPFNVLAGGTDINGDQHSTNDRPLGFGRNSGHGPSFVEWDMRLSRTFYFGDHESLQLLAEGFNLANHTNYASVNNEVPTVNGFADIPLHPTGFAVNPQLNSPGGTPLAFTSAFPERQFQFGFRFAF